jgi:hypothetical protein
MLEISFQRQKTHMNSVEDRMILLCSTNNRPGKPNIGKGVDDNEIDIILFKILEMSCDLQDPRNEHKWPSSLCYF